MKKKIFTGIAIVVLISLITGWYSKAKKFEKENARLQNNIEYYSSLGTENIVLQSTVKELQNSNDSLIQSIDSVRNLLGLKPKQIKTIAYTETIIRDTIHDSIPVTTNFRKTIKPNEQTSIEVIREDSMLTVIPEISNSQTLFIQEESKYKYKGFFNRLIHFNFKKIKTDRYYIDNSNDLIQTGDTRIINVVE